MLPHRRAGVREFLFGKRVGSQKLTTFAADEWNKSSDRDLPEEINLFYRMQAAFTADEIRNYSAPACDPHSEIYYPSVGIFVARDSTFCTAVKAGNNGGSHRHNDTGSLIVYKNGVPFLIDVGVESYTKKTFSQDRYGIWTMQSVYHNLPSFGGITQEPGEEYGASQVKAKFGPEQSRISMDLTAAYPKEAGLERYLRSVTLHKGNGISVENSFSGSCGSAVLSLMVCGEPKIDGRTIAVGNIGTIQTADAGEITAERIPIIDPKLRQAWPEVIWRILVPFTQTIVLEMN